MDFAAAKIIRVTLAIAVALWMAGAGCLLGCENAVMAASSLSVAVSDSPTVSGDACASSRSHDCCAKRKSISSHPQRAPGITSNLPVNTLASGLGAIPSPSMADCPLAVNASAVVSRARQDQSSDGIPLDRLNVALPVLREQVLALSSPLRLPNRGHTYLRCCVFLI